MCMGQVADVRHLLVPLSTAGQIFTDSNQTWMMMKYDLTESMGEYIIIIIIIIQEYIRLTAIHAPPHLRGLER